MIGKHNVYWQNNIVGEAIVTKSGMFFEISCNCDAPSNGAYYLWSCWDNHSEKIGICALGLDGYGLKTTLSAKRIGKGPVRFEMRERETEQNLIFIEDITDPYSLLIKLPDLRIRVAGNKYGIIIKQKAGDLPDNGQIL